VQSLHLDNRWLFCIAAVFAPWHCASIGFLALKWHCGLIAFNCIWHHTWSDWIISLAASLQLGICCYRCNWAFVAIAAIGHLFVPRMSLALPSARHINVVWFTWHLNNATQGIQLPEHIALLDSGASISLVSVDWPEVD
jgi:hypothetical protein